MDENMIYFESNRNELVNKHFGEYILLTGGVPVGFYPDFRTARMAALEKLANDDDMLIEKCIDEDLRKSQLFVPAVSLCPL